MRTLLILCMLAACASASAQIRVGIRLEHPTVLQYEPIRAFITVYNDSDEPLAMSQIDGTNNFTLEMSVSDASGANLMTAARPPSWESLRVAPDSKQTLMCDVSQWFDIVSSQYYVVTVQGTFRNDRFESNRAMLKVVPGIEMVSVDQAVDGYRDRMRHYSLRYWKRDSFEHLFLCVSEPGRQTTWGVFDLGTLIRFNKPTLDISRSGDVKVIHQSARQRFTHSLFKSELNEVRFVDQTYHLSGGEPYPKPKLAGAETGTATRAEVKVGDETGEEAPAEAPVEVPAQADGKSQETK
jgi:hypothetical protein